MGHHYVPQYYLKGFSKDDGKVIWGYDKHENRSFSTQVKSIANETGFYSPEMEEYLANIIEGPANDVLRKIRDRAKISITDKRILSAYMTCMMKRVPKGMELLREHAPSVAQDLREEIKEALDLITIRQPEAVAAHIRERGSELLELIDSYSKDPPREVWESIIPPGKSPKVLSAFMLMTWRFFTFDEYPAFLTSDNPVAYLTYYGMEKPESEVTFPISSHIALWAALRPDLEEGVYSPTTPKVVRELNRRTASFATRYAFHSICVDWVLPLLTKGRWSLNRIQ